MTLRNNPGSRRELIFQEVHIETILAGATEQKEYVFLERVQLKMLLDECRETINAFPQISPAAGDIYLLQI